MAQRRDRPPVQRSGSSIGLRFPDGSVRAMPMGAAADAATADSCCFCGESVEDSDAERVYVSVRWIEDERERTQGWNAHRTCLAERINDAVAGTGPFFGD
jgi:hypothetical protein